MVLGMLEEGFGDLLEIHVISLTGNYDLNAPLHWRNRRELSGNNMNVNGYSK